MTKKFTFIVVWIIALFLISMLQLKISKAVASGTIYIRNDGRVDPPDTPIFSADNITYTLIGDVSYTIVVERNNIVLDGAGFSLRGNKSGYGIDISQRNNVTIKNMKIENFFHGIYLWYSCNNSITGNNIRGNVVSGIRLFRISNYNTIWKNNITRNGNGIGLVDSTGNKMFENNIQYNNLNMELYGCYSNFIYHNNFIVGANQSQAYSFHKDNLWDYWDSGYPSGGNYWSDYKGADMFNGIFQNDTGSDGIADVAFIINERNEKNRDHYPLMGTFRNIAGAYEVSICFISNSSIINYSFCLNNRQSVILRFIISGKNQTQGFFRIDIPRTLINCSYKVAFDGVIIGYPKVRELPCSDITILYVYINYVHSEHTIEIIVATPLKMEIFVLVAFALLLMEAILVLIVCRKDRFWQK